MDYSISIGIGTYLNLETTKYACEDAEEFHRIMQEVYDIKSRILLKNERATVAQMKDTIEKTVRNMSEGDRLFFTLQVMEFLFMMSHDYLAMIL